jgi:hypothetical protein
VALSLFLCLLSLALVGIVLFAALVPVVECPEGCLRGELPRPCSYCNGWGKSPVLQSWYYMHFQWQRENYSFQICGTGMPRPRSLWERAVDRVAALISEP